VSEGWATVSGMGHLLGHGRVSTSDQQPQLLQELDASGQDTIAAIATTLGVSHTSISRHPIGVGS
jgi:hypothetical protein